MTIQYDKDGTINDKNPRPGRDIENPPSPEEQPETAPSPPYNSLPLAVAMLVPAS
eukprot:CAMPEP_0172502844 /NCGR_PEP_ID=MMETSP1066-20121228/163163_1 /TAXON_ID=671091 /ORGANISM="Coscinodiscus wailesii, Strain CCMP2513" /LENGTH=54 /DNA_ID=CAMNT_0013278249 /DNA_START=71 /DNA_END=231 /DNA_ORIENTATION=+